MSADSFSEILCFGARLLSSVIKLLVVESGGGRSLQPQVFFKLVRVHLIRLLSVDLVWEDEFLLSGLVVGVDLFVHGLSALILFPERLDRLLLHHIY